MQMSDADARKFYCLTQIHYIVLIGQRAGDSSTCLAKLDSALALDSAFVQIRHSDSRIVPGFHE